MIGSITFYLIFCSTDLTKKAARITSNSVDLSIISFKYYKFADIFNKSKAETLVFYHLYNIQIKLKNREKPLIRTIYSLVKNERSGLHIFLFSFLIFILFFNLFSFILFLELWLGLE